MHYTFSREEFKEFLEARHIKSRIFEEKFEYLSDFLNDSLCWDRKLSCLNHLFSIILEQFEKKNIDNQGVIDFVYQLCESHDFEIQEGSLRFIESLFSNDIGTGLTLEEELIIAENKIYALR